MLSSPALRCWWSRHSRLRVQTLSDIVTPRDMMFSAYSTASPCMWEEGGLFFSFSQWPYTLLLIRYDVKSLVIKVRTRYCCTTWCDDPPRASILFNHPLASSVNLIMERRAWTLTHSPVVCLCALTCCGQSGENPWPVNTEGNQGPKCWLYWLVYRGWWCQVESSAEWLVGSVWYLSCHMFAWYGSQESQYRWNSKTKI